MFFSVPSGSPQNINCQSRSPNSLLLEWSKPAREERNGIIRGYWLQYYPRTLWYGKSVIIFDLIPLSSWWIFHQSFCKTCQIHSQLRSEQFCFNSAPKDTKFSQNRQSRVTYIIWFRLNYEKVPIWITMAESWPSIKQPHKLFIFCWALKLIFKLFAPWKLPSQELWQTFVIEVFATFRDFGKIAVQGNGRWDAGAGRPRHFHQLQHQGGGHHSRRSRKVEQADLLQNRRRW